jgi:hypothetical protein
MPSIRGLELADAINDLRAQLIEAQAAAGNSDIEFSVGSVTIELQLVATAEGGGKAGFKVPVIDFEFGVEGGYSQERTHKLVIELNAPVDKRTKQPLKVAEPSRANLD